MRGPAIQLPITVRCPACSAPLRIGEARWIGRPITCPACQSRFSAHVDPAGKVLVQREASPAARNVAGEDTSESGSRSWSPMTRWLAAGSCVLLLGLFVGVFSLWRTATTTVSDENSLATTSPATTATSAGDGGAPDATAPNTAESTSSQLVGATPAGGSEGVPEQEDPVTQPAVPGVLSEHPDDLPLTVTLLPESEAVVANPPAPGESDGNALPAAESAPLGPPPINLEARLAVRLRQVDQPSAARASDLLEQVRDLLGVPFDVQSLTEEQQARLTRTVGPLRLENSSVADFLQAILKPLDLSYRPNADGQTVELIPIPPAPFEAAGRP